MPTAPRPNLYVSLLTGNVAHVDEAVVRGWVKGPEGTVLRVGGEVVKPRNGVFVSVVEGLQEGENQIVATATGPGGERATKTIRVDFEPREAYSGEEDTDGTSGDSAQAPAGETFAVDTTNDAPDAEPGDGKCAAAEGACTLRAAVQESDASSGKDTVRLSDGTYRLRYAGDGDESSTALEVTDPAGLSVVGAGSDSTEIDGEGTDRVFKSSSTGDLEVSDLAMSGGSTAAQGGGIFVQGDLVVSDATISGNEAEGAGGGIYVEGNLTVTDSTVSNNVANGNGGGIHFQFGDLTVTRSNINGNESRRSTSDSYFGGEGGGIYACCGGAVRIDESSVDSNTARWIGGGIIVDDAVEEIELKNSSVSRNRVETDNRSGQGGGIAIFPGYPQSFTSMSNVTITGNVVAGNGYGGGGVMYGGYSTGDTLKIDRSTISDNSTVGIGGGMVASCGAALAVSHSTVSGNHASSKETDPGSSNPFSGGGGGGLAFEPCWSPDQKHPQLTNTTISGNSASGGQDWTGAGMGGGGVLSYDALSLTNVTLNANSAPFGSNVASYGDVMAKNTIVTNGVGSGGCGPTQPSPLASEGHNLDSGNTCGFGQPTDLNNTDPLFEPLADYGGPTKTHKLAPNSPAIDAGGDYCPPTDQRGVVRMHDGNGDGSAESDIGAFEVERSPGPTKQCTLGKFNVQVDAPSSLSVEDGGLNPNPFTVSATVRYDGFVSAEGASVSLSTSPDGLSILDGADRSLGAMNPGDERQVSWQVQAAPHDAQQTHDMEVAVSGAGLAPVKASKQVIVPAFADSSSLEVHMNPPSSLELISGGRVAPNPFPVEVFVQNTSSQPINNAAVHLSTTPEGLSVERAEGYEGTDTVSLGTIEPGQEEYVRFLVRAYAREEEQHYTLQSDVTADGGNREIDYGTVAVPAFGHWYVAIGDSTTTGYAVRVCNNADHDVDPNEPQNAGYQFRHGCRSPEDEPPGEAPPAPPYPELVSDYLGAPYDGDLNRVGVWGYQAEEAIVEYREANLREDDRRRDSAGNVTEYESQLHAVDDARGLVTVSLGINDMDFSGWDYWYRAYAQGELESAASYRYNTEVEPYLEPMYSDHLSRARGRGVRVLATLYPNTITSDPLKVGCRENHTIAEEIVTTLNENISQMAAEYDIETVSFYDSWTRNGADHGAGSADPWVFGTGCDINAALLGQGPDFYGIGNYESEFTLMNSIQQTIDPHPNQEGTEAMAREVERAFRGQP